MAAVGEKVAEIYAASRLCASSDLLLAFATLAEQRNYCQPECDDGLGLHILQGRHPVIEQLLDSDFIPNDTLFDGEQNQLLLLTGPNMGGKSTYLRQVALIVLLAQAGSSCRRRALASVWPIGSSRVWVPAIIWPGASRLSTPR